MPTKILLNTWAWSSPRRTIWLLQLSKCLRLSWLVVVESIASEHCLTDRPHCMLWLAKGYALPASMYASQIWGTRYMKQGAEMDCPLQTVHMCLLKGIFGVKRTTPNWSVLRECGQEPLQFYWFRAAVRFDNALLCSNSSTLAKVLKPDIVMSTINKKCWSAGGGDSRLFGPMCLLSLNRCREWFHWFHVVSFSFFFSFLLPLLEC